ncbi:putative sperm motility kinase W [Callospermophilus lateralis]|uniref:putative sperm motility kinase W n=1 Tax=Callospermophilus lateralis TaxID=76772 RepID=UPI0040386D4B
MHSKSSEFSVVTQEPDSFQEKAFTDHYQVVKDIDQGAFGQVILARHLRTGAKVAVKVLPRCRESLVQSEILAMKTLNHPNVIQLFQVIETTTQIYMVMEYGVGGSLFDLIPPKGMQEKEARRLFRQIACAVCYCHKMHILHGDLKPQNVVLDARGNIRIIDFGFSVMFQPGQKLAQFWGTLDYLAPECILKEVHEGPPVDCWSLGVLLYFMLTGHRPFKVASMKGLMRKILHPKLKFPWHISAKAKRLIKKILTVDPRARLSAEEILADPWLNQGEENLSYHDVPLPNLSDPTVLTMLFDMGYDPYSTWVSLSQRKFDEVMASYLIIQQQISQGAGCMKPVRRDPSISPALPQRRASEPALHTFPLPCEHHQPQEAKESGQKGFRRASWPAISLRCLHEKPPTPRLASQHHSVSDSAQPCPSTAASHVSQDATTVHPRGHRKGWKRVRRRMAACFRRLCCCTPSCDGENEAPTPGEQKPARFTNRVVPT